MNLRLEDAVKLITRAQQILDAEITTATGIDREMLEDTATRLDELREMLEDIAL